MFGRLERLLVGIVKVSRCVRLKELSHRCSDVLKSRVLLRISLHRLDGLFDLALSERLFNQSVYVRHRLLRLLRLLRWCGLNVLLLRRRVIQRLQRDAVVVQELCETLHFFHR